jgi:hypothetical protein
VARHTFLYIGPYAEWVVPEEHDEEWTADEDATWEKLLDAGQLVWNIGNDWLHVERDGKRFLRYCAMPQEVRAGPDRSMHFKWDHSGEPEEMATDWTKLDQQAEIQWFHQAFRAELKEAAALIGEPPAMRWGLVHWCYP